MNRSEWTEAFVLYLMNLTDADESEAGYEAEQSILYQIGRYGDDPNMWQGPEAAAHEVLREWQDVGEDIGEPDEPPEPQPKPVEDGEL